MDQLTTQALNMLPEGIFAATLLQLRAELAAMSGRYADALTDLRATRQALGQSNDAQFVKALLYAEALTAHGRGDLGTARRLAADGLVSDISAQYARYVWPLTWIAIRIEADEATLARDRREDVPAHVVERCQELARSAKALDGRMSLARGYHALITAEHARAAGQDEGPAWSAAADTWRQSGEPYPLAYALLRLAEVTAAAGDRASASRDVRQAHALAQQLGAIPLADEAMALARRARLSLDEAGPAIIAGPGDPLARFGLTEREREILLLLAAGQSNPQIARALFISAKTASVHVSNILTKLGVTGRVEAAAVAHRLGVIGPATD